MLSLAFGSIPDNKDHGANIGPIWGWQGPDGSHVGPMNFAIWDVSIPNIALGFFLILIAAKHSCWYWCVYSEIFVNVYTYNVIP